jgi:hypothetical protein
MCFWLITTGYGAVTEDVISPSIGEIKWAFAIAVKDGKLSSGASRC